MARMSCSYREECSISTEGERKFAYFESDILSDMPLVLIHSLDHDRQLHLLSMFPKDDLAIVRGEVTMK